MYDLSKIVIQSPGATRWMFIPVCTCHLNSSRKPLQLFLAHTRTTRCTGLQRVFFRLMMALTPKRLFLSFSLSLFMSISLLRLFSRAHYWVNKYIQSFFYRSALLWNSRPLFRIIYTHRAIQNSKAIQKPLKQHWHSQKFTNTLHHTKYSCTPFPALSQAWFKHQLSTVSVSDHVFSLLKLLYTQVRQRQSFSRSFVP